MPLILVADNHPDFLLGISQDLYANGYTKCIQTNNGREALNTISERDVQIAILSIDLPHLTGIAVIKKAKELSSSTRFILIIPFADRKVLIETQALGISGYLLRQFALVELKTCIKNVAMGLSYLSPKLEVALEDSSEINKLLKLLTSAELKILKLISSDQTTPQIAEQLFVSPKTVEKHRSNIIKKLNLSGKTNSLLLWVKENYKSID